jgi:hypothetical protein
VATVTNPSQSKSKSKPKLLGDINTQMGLGLPGTTAVPPTLPMNPQGPLGMRNLAPIAIQNQGDAQADTIAASPALNSVAKQAGKKKKELVRRPGNLSNGGGPGALTGSSQIQ